MNSLILKIKKNLLSRTREESILRVPYFVLTISIIVTIAVTYFYYSSAKANDLVRFENETARIKGIIESRLNTYIALLRSGRGYFNACQNINRAEFSQFVGNLNLRKSYPGVLAIGYSKIFTDKEKEALERQMKLEGVSDFKITPDTPRTDYQAIIFIEPFDEYNKTSIGFDMSSEQVRKLAIDNARDTGNFATSGKVTLIQDNDDLVSSGFFIYFPIYKTKNIPESIEERRKEITGFIYSPFRADEFASDIIQKGGIDELSFQIYDNEIEENNLLIRGTEINEKHLLTKKNTDKNSAESLFRGQNEIDVGGRKWLVTYTPTEKFNSHSLIWWTPIIFCLGLAISVILFFLSLSQSWSNQNLIKTANDLAQTSVIVQTLLTREKEARLEAEKSAKVKNEFLATISHELKTPLNAIVGWVNILKLGVDEKEIKDKAIRIINKNIHHQAELIEQMIVFSDKDFLVNRNNWHRFSFLEIVKECLNKVTEEISNGNLSLFKKLPENDLEIDGDEEKIKTAISYLLDNAIKFTPEGGKILIELNSQNNQINLKIQDTGEGIRAEMIPLILEGFRQSDSSIIRKHGGLGLSLAIAKKIIEEHHGKLFIESEGLEKGTLLTITLPLAV